MDTKEFTNSYKRLNKEQKRAVDMIEGPVAVIAGPGTGKTTILSLRIANILRKTDTKPEQILALTFTNAGVRAMREKLFTLIGDASYRLNIFTFHSFCEYVIKNFEFYFEDFSSRSAIDDIERINVVEKIIKSSEYKHITSKNDELSSVKRILDAIDSIKSEGLSPKEFDKRILDWRNSLMSSDEVYYKKKTGVYKAGDIKPAEADKIEGKVNKAKEICDFLYKYEEELTARRYYDFNDMVLSVINALENNSDLRLELGEQFQYVHVDEHQDTNDGQNKLIELLTNAPHLEGRPNLFTVGDEKQSIYRFQGASEKTFNHLIDLFRDVEIISLKENYRSTKDILDSSHSLICLNGEKYQDHKLSTQKSNSEKVEVSEFSNYKFELLYVAKKILELIKKGEKPNDIAIIYRKNKLIDDIKHVLLAFGIPFSVYSKDNVLSDPHIQSAILLLKSVSNLSDDESLAKLLLCEFLGLPQNEVIAITNGYAFEKRKNTINLVSYLGDSRKLSKIGIVDTSKYESISKKLISLKSESDNYDAVDFFKKVLNDCGYISHIAKSKDGIINILKLDKIFEEIKRHKSKKKNYYIKDIVTLFDLCDKYEIEVKSEDLEIVDGVRLMTAHKSKGLEFKYVFIVNATRKNWEKQRGGIRFSLPIDTVKECVEDERRLFYVAMTRAKNGLYISSSQSDWEGGDLEKSQFLNEIEEQSIKRIETADFEKTSIGDLKTFLTYYEKKKDDFDKDLIKRLFLERGISVTALNNYIKCPLKYFYKNLVRIPSPYSPIMIYGDAVHKTLEYFFKKSKEEGVFLKKQEILDSFKGYMLETSLNDRDYKKYLKRGLENISDYYDEYHKKWSFNVDVEQKITKTIEIQDEKIKLTGKIDKIIYLDKIGEGNISLVDYKTGKTYSQKDKQEKEGLDRQIVFYHLLLDGYRDGFVKIQEALLDFIEKNEEKKAFEQKTKNVTDEDIQHIKEEIFGMTKDILSGDFLKKGCGEKNCEYCALKNL